MVLNYRQESEDGYFDRKVNLFFAQKINQSDDKSMNIVRLADKVKYEQKFRILEEQREIDKQEQVRKDKEKDEIIQRLTERLEKLEANNQLIQAQNTQIVNGNVNNINITQNI